MAFDLDIWKVEVSRRMEEWKPRMQRAGVNSVYAFLSAAALWPVVEAARSGEWVALAVLGNVLAGVGSNLLANRIQGWKDEADAAQQLATDAAEDSALRAELDAILEKLEAFPQAQAGLAESDQEWFTQTLRAELARLGNLDRFQATLIGSGAVAQGEDAQAVGERGIGTKDFRGVAVTGDQNTVILAAEAAEAFWQQFVPRRLSATSLRQSTKRYLTHLLDRYRYLDFKGMGVSDRVPLRLPLVEMYIPLKARIELPEGETWARELRLAGRQVSAEESEDIGQRLSQPMPALDLLHQHDGLIVLGDPGAGKTTFLKYLALRLALGEGEALSLGARLPVLLPLSAYANALALATRDVPLDRFIAEYYRDLGVDLPVGPMLDEALTQGGALLLLDGLDEVRELAQRHLVVRRVVDFFAFHRGQGNKFILTSRIVGYREVRPIAEGLAECTLVDFEDEEITQFVEKWTGALERAARGDTPVAVQEATREREELLDAVHRNPGVRRLAANPLLLTILALMKRQGVTLPERRVELYQKYVETLLKHWNLVRGLGRPPGRDLDVVETMRVLAPLALWMHETSPSAGLVKREDIRRKLEEIYAGRGIPEPEWAAWQLLADAREYAGLLLERGPRAYGFIHVTFQEYLAAVAIALRGQREVGPVVDLLADHIGDDNWHEVTLLTIGYVGIVQQRDEAAGVTLSELIQAAPGEPGQPVVLAGEAVIDAWPGGVTPACKATIVESLQQVLTDDAQVKPRLRAAAGNALAKLGDPRPGVGVDPETDLPDITWCYVPHGPFVMGSQDDPMALGDEQPQHTRDIPYDYWISRYPVTVAQFYPFVEDPEGYRAHRWWTKAGLKWRGNRGKPAEYGEPYNLPNHPMVGVTWYEAVAFTCWLTEKLRQASLLPEGWIVRLPSEAEWEKGARGGLQILHAPIVGRQPLASGEQRLVENPAPKRRYLWGDELDPNRANCGDTVIGATSTVGCFPGGASPYGMEDLSGNVWEWTRSLWGKEKGYPDFKYPYNPADGRENLKADDKVLRVVRGGAFYNHERYIRCAYRRRNLPYNQYINQGLRLVVAPL